MKLLKTNKKLLAGLLVGASTLMAFNMPATAGSGFDGPYIGAQIGFGKTSADSNYEPGTSGNTAFSSSNSMSGLNGGIFAGYGKIIKDKFWLGGELSYSRSSADYNASNSGVAITLEQSQTFEASIRPGYLVQDDTLLYGRLGFVKTKFDATATDGTNSFSGSETLNGFRLGLGAEKIVKDNISLRLDGSYTNYEDYSVSDATTQEKATLDAGEILFRIGTSFRF